MSVVSTLSDGGTQGVDAQDTDSQTHDCGVVPRPHDISLYRSWRHIPGLIELTKEELADIRVGLHFSPENLINKIFSEACAL